MDSNSRISKMPSSKPTKKGTTRATKPVKIPREEKKLINGLPLLQVLSEMHPMKRIILLSHLDPMSTDNVITAVQYGVKRLRKKGSVPTALKRKMERTIRMHAPVFKSLSKAGPKYVQKRRQELMQIGGGPLALLLSFVIPSVLGSLLKK